MKTRKLRIRPAWILASSVLLASCSLNHVDTPSGTAHKQSRSDARKVQDCYIENTLCFDIPEKRNDYLKDELVLLGGTEVPEAVFEKFAKKYHLEQKQSTTIESLGWSMKVMDTGDQDPYELKNRINRVEEEIEAATNNIYQVSTISGYNDSLEEPKYPKSLTGVYQAEKFSTGEGVLIGMIDGPIDINHRDYADRLVDQVPLVDFDNNSVAQMAHGTAIAGILVGDDPQIGIAPGARLLSIAAFSYNKDQKEVTSSSSSVVQAIDKAIESKVDILNLSFSGGEDDLVKKMVVKAVEKGILVVSSCGNDSSSKPRFPAAYDGVIAVTAVDHLKHIYKKANIGMYIDVSAPGVGVLTTSPGNRVKLATGTSVAAAHVSGSLALLLGKSKHVARDLLNETAVDLGVPGPDDQFGYGLMDVLRAMNSLN